MNSMGGLLQTILCISWVAMLASAFFCWVELLHLASATLAFQQVGFGLKLIRQCFVIFVDDTSQRSTTHTLFHECVEMMGWPTWSWSWPGAGVRRTRTKSHIPLRWRRTRRRAGCDCLPPQRWPRCSWPRWGSRRGNPATRCCRFGPSVYRRKCR